MPSGPYPSRARVMLAALAALGVTLSRDGDTCVVTGAGGAEHHHRLLVDADLARLRGARRGGRGGGAAAGGPGCPGA